MNEPSHGLKPIVLTAAVVACSLLGDSFLYVALPLEFRSLGLGLVSVGVLLSVNRFIRFFSNTWAGYTYSRYRVKFPLIAAIIVGALVTLSYSVVAGFLAFLLVRAIWGIAWSFLRLAGYLTVVAAPSRKRLGRTMGLYQSISSFGSLCGALVGGYLLDLWGFRPTVIFLTCWSAVGIPLAISLKEGQAPPIDAGMELTRVNIKLIMGDVKMLGIGLCTLVNSLLLQGILVSTLSLYLLELVGGGGVNIFGVAVGIATLSGFLLTFRLLSRFIFGPIFGTMSDRFGRQRTLTILFIGGMAGMAMLGLTRSVYVIAPAVLLAFISSAGLMVTLATEASDIAASLDQGREYVMSSYANWSDLGSAMGPLIAYVMRLGIPFRTTYLGSSVILLTVAIFHNITTYTRRL